MSLGLLRSLLITDPLIILATIMMGSVSLVVSFFDTGGRKQSAVARAWSRLLLRIGGVEVAVDGIEKINLQGSYVFVANHASFMDTPVVLGHIPVQFRFLAKQGLFSIPFLGHHLKRAGHLPVPKDSPRDAVKMMAEAGRIIRERGISVLVFPEGGRSLEGLQPFKEGAAYIAIKAGVPVVPVALVGTFEILPMGSAQVRPGPVTLRIGDPIPTADLKIQDRARLSQQLYDRVFELLQSVPLVEARTGVRAQESIVKDL
jgi:1-acyl-sn-glycerol-3-phosphate acyltransferase